MLGNLHFVSGWGQGPRYIAVIVWSLSDQSYTWIGVDHQGLVKLVFFRVRAGPNVSQHILYRYVIR